MKPEKHNLQLGIIYPNAAALDVGSMEMYLSYINKQGEAEVKTVKAFTRDLEKLATELKESSVTHVAMEATGVYWMTLYEILEKQNIQVTLVNAKHFKNTNAQKTDVKDCQWLHQLHAHGLLRASHVATENYRQLRTYIHERTILQKHKSDGLNRIHRALTQMNIKVQHLISDIEGVSGMKIIRAIAQGIHEPEQILAQVNIKMLKAGKEDLLKALTGYYKPHFINVLKKQLQMYDFVKQQMQEYEVLIEEVLKQLLPSDEKGNKPVISNKKKLTRKNQYHFNLKAYLLQLTGVDLTAIDGVDEISALTVLSVTGLDLTKWKTAEHFASWLNLAPRPMKTGGKIFGYQKRVTNNPASQVLRVCAQSLWKCKSPIGQFYRNLSARKGSKKAIKATACKLAKVIYKMLVNKTAYNPLIVVENSAAQKARKIMRLQKEATKLGFTIAPAIDS
jgi:transposase